MIGPIHSNMAALLRYEEKMAAASDRISKAFQTDENVNVATEFAKTTILEHGHSASIKTIRVQEDMMDSVLDIIV